MQEDWRKRAIGWLGKNNADQQEWAITYLGKKRWFDRDRRLDELSYDFLVTHIRNAPEGAKSENDLRKMKRAWTQKKKRDDKRGPTKSYSFIMSKSVGLKLKYLKKRRGEPAYQIVEMLVSDFHQEVKTKAWLEMSQRRLEKRLNDLDQQLDEVDRKQKELESREEALQRQEEKSKQWAEEVSQLEDEVLEYAETVDSKVDLISQLCTDYADILHAITSNRWVIGRKTSLPPVPLNYQGRAKAACFLEPYQDLLASLKR